MKQQHVHQELLVFTTTSYSRKVLCKAKVNDTNEKDFVVEKLNQACWNGLLIEKFPEIIGSGSTLFPIIFICGIYTGESCLLIDLADTPGVINTLLSLDLYLFLRNLNLN